MSDNKQRNYVAKNMRHFNVPATHIDKKAESKKGKVKHKGNYHDS